MDAIFLGVVLFASFTAARDVLRLSGNIQARCLTDTLLIQVSKDFTDANNVTFFVQDRNGTAFLLSPSLNAKCGYKQQLNRKGEVEVTVSFLACHMYLQDRRLRISMVMEHVPRDISGPMITEHLSLFCPHKASNALRRLVCEEAYVEVSQKLGAHFNDLNAGRTSQWRFEVRNRAGKTVVRGGSWISEQGVVVLADRWDGLVTVRVPHSSPLVTSKDYNGFRTLDYSIVAKNQEVPGSQYNLSAVCPVAQVSCRDGKVFASAANVKLLASPGGAEDLSLRMQLDGVTVSQEDSTAMGYTLSLGERQLQLSFSAGTHPLPNADSSAGKANGHRMSLVHVWRGQGEKRDTRVLIHVPPHSCHPLQPSPRFTVSVMEAGFNVTYGPVPAAYTLTGVSADGERFQSAKNPRGGLQVELLPGQRSYYVSILARFGSRLVLPQYIQGLVSQYSITPALRFLGPGQEERVEKGEGFTHSQEDIVLPALEGYCRNGSVCFKVRRGNADHLWSLYVWDSAFQPQRAAERLHSLDNYRDVAHLCVDVRSPDLLHQRVSEDGRMLVLGVAYRVLRSGEVKVGAQHTCPFPPTEELACTAEGEFVVSGLRLSASPHAQLDLVTLRDPSCGPTAVSHGTVSFTFPLTACGTIRKVQDGFVEYENTISRVNLLNGSAPEYLKFESTLVCRYSTMGVSLLKSREEPHPGVLPAHSHGKFLLHMDIMKDPAFSAAFRVEEYPVVKRLQEPVFVEVGVRSADPQVEIFLKDCWGSPSPKPEHPLTWSIIKDGCEVKEDEYSTIFHKVQPRSHTLLPQHYKHFEVKTFTFVKLRELLNLPIHFHCSVVICDLTALSNDEACQAQCILDKQRTGRSAGSERKREELVISGSVLLLPTGHSSNTALACLRGVHDGLFTGQIDAVDTSAATYRVTFDLNGLGTHTVPDYEVLSTEPHETMPISAFAQKQRASRFQAYATPPRVPYASPAQTPMMDDLLLGQSSWNSKLSGTEGDTLGGFSVPFLVQVTRLSKILMIKKEHINQLKEMNTDAEKTVFEFQKRYATVVLDLEQLNKDLSKVLHEVQQYSYKLAPKQGLQTTGQSLDLHQRCLEEAREMMRQANTLPNGQHCIRNESLTNLISGLTTLLLQIKCLAEGSDLNSFEFKSLSDCLNDIKNSVDSSNSSCFQNDVEVHVAHIQGGLSQMGNLHAFSANNTNIV